MPESIPKTTAGDHQRIDGFDIFMQIVLTVMILLPPLAMGAVGPWARSALCVAALALMAAWALQGVWRGELHIVRSHLWFFILAFLALSLFQLVPLPEALLKSVSPAAWRTYAAALTGYAASGDARPLSLSAHATRGELVRIAIPAVVLFVTANVVRTRRQAIALIVALAALGSFEALYGFAEQFSGNKHIFWMPRQYHLSAVTSTFHNKNHFAGLLEMIVPVTLGLLVAIGRTGARRIGNRVSRESRPRLGRALKILGALSSPTVGRQVVLAAAATVMIVAIFFSLSRAGIACALVSLAGFFFFLRVGEGTRRYAIVLLLIAAAVLTISVGIGMELVVTRVEEAASGQSTSWTDRLDLAKSATSMIRDYPLFGAGLGSFGVVFPAYQSARFGDAWADYLHNDWLQALCETGLIGGTILALAALLLLVTLLRSATNPKNPFCRWIAVGGLLGVVAMLLHSFFDYNLSKITSNGIIFAVIAGLPFGAENIRNAGEAFRKPRYWEVPIGPAPARVAITVGAVVALGAGVYFSFSAAVADIYFNRYLAASTSGAAADDYFFIPTKRVESRRSEFQAAGFQPASHESGALHAGDSDSSLLDKALTYQPLNPLYLYYRAHDAIGSADELVGRAAEQRALSILGDGVADADPGAYNRVVDAIAKDMRAEMLAERKPFLVEAREYLLRAVEAAPTVARYHIALAAALDELGEPREEVLERTLAGVGFAPNKPGVLYDAGRIYMSQASDARGDEEYGPTASKAFEYFRRTIFADPSYTERIYPTLSDLKGGSRALLTATPRTIAAYERLCAALSESGDWETLLACVDEIEILIDHRAERPTSSGFAQGEAHADEEPNIGRYETAAHTRGAVGYDRRDTVSIRLSAAQRRSDALGIMGRWPERSESISQYREILREHLGPDLDEARRLRALGRTREALALCLDGLNEDWSDPAALLEAAELSQLPGSVDETTRRSGPLDHLYRLIVNNDTISPAQYERMKTILDGVEPKTRTEEALAGFITGAGAVLAGRFEEGAETLGALARSEEEASEPWRRRHLIWYYLGLAHEASGRGAEAVEAYRRAVEIVATHRPSLVRLSILSGFSDRGAVERLSELTPEVALNINFGGKVTLLGYTIDREAEPEAWFITCYWRFTDDMAEGYRPVLRFCDGDWNTIFRSDSRIRSAGALYPMDLARCGEVVADKRWLRRDPAVAKYMRVGIWTPEPEKFAPKILYRDGGKGLARIGLTGVGSMGAWKTAFCDLRERVPAKPNTTRLSRKG